MRRAKPNRRSSRTTRIAAAGIVGGLAASIVAHGADAVPIGLDDRVRVNPTTGFPFHAIGSLDRPGAAPTVDCTGWFYSASGVATAGHCLYSSGAYLAPAGDFIFTPGRNGAGSSSSVKPYGFCVGTARAVSPNWITAGTIDYDYGALRVDCSNGNVTGPIARFPNVGTGVSAFVSGYPNPAPFSGTVGWQYKAYGTIDVLMNSGRLMRYSIDTSAGQSGSPVPHHGGTYNNWSNGIHGGAYSSTSNRGVRFTLTVISNLDAWD